MLKAEASLRSPQAAASDILEEILGLHEASLAESMEEMERAQQER